MIVRIAKAVELKLNNVIQAVQFGEVLSLPDDKAKKLLDAGCAVPVCDTEETLSDELSLWRWFMVEANRVYQTSTKDASLWKNHETNKKAAVSLCKMGRISAARHELEKALTALQGPPARRCYSCHGTDFWQSAMQDGVSSCRRCHPPMQGTERVVVTVQPALSGVSP